MAQLELAKERAHIEGVVTEIPKKFDREEFQEKSFAGYYPRNSYHSVLYISKRNAGGYTSPKVVLIARIFLRDHEEVHVVIREAGLEQRARHTCSIGLVHIKLR